METFEDSLAQAGDALGAFAEGPGREAATTLEQAFGEAGQSIEAALTRAARTGELDFSRMAQSVLADLARIVAEAALARPAAGQAGHAFTFNMSVPGQPAAMPAARAEIAKAVAKAAAIGGRFQ